jgi:hypothetical protein
MGEPNRSTSDQYAYSKAVQATVQVAFPIAPHMTWDAYVRLFYDRADKALQEQANALLRRGNITWQEARTLVESERNGLVTAFRDRLSPPGRLYSELLKPSNDLPTLERLVQQKGTIEAVLTSVGKSRTFVNRLAVATRVAGPALIVLQVTISGVAIYTAAPADRGRVAAREAGSIALGTLGGLGGAWAGCASFAALASPSMIIPFVGPVTTGGACLVGAVLVGGGVGYVGARVGDRAGVAAYNFLTTINWK